MKAINLKTQHLIDPMGLQSAAPILTWTCQEGLFQTAYQILAYTDNQLLWDSGKVISPQMQCRYAGPALQPRQSVTWTLQLWDENDMPGDIGRASFEMGLTDQKWQAQWIDPELPHEPEERQPASILRKRFSLSSAGFSAEAADDQPTPAGFSAEAADDRPSSVVKSRARLYITCHGLYEAFLNGHRVGDFVLAPGADDYRLRLQYQTYDVTHLLQEGSNELLITLGDGWYRGNNGVDGLYNYYGSDLALLCQLEVDGQIVLCSDESWEASQSGPIRLNDMEKGETYDARRSEITDWHAVQVAEHPFDTLCCSEALPIREQETFTGKLLTTPSGESIIDFGQNLAGYSSFTLTAKEGTVITLWHGETLDEKGNFTQANYAPGDRNKNGGIPQRIDYICKEGFNEYKPHFTIFGFRYAKVEISFMGEEGRLRTASTGEAADLLSHAVFTAVAVYSGMPQTGNFTCGNEDVNRLFSNSLWSMRSNFCDIPTDCPTRERAGWTGDAAAFAPTAVYLMDCYTVLRKWLAECRLAQKEDGLVANIAPVNCGDSYISKMLQGSSGWGDACVLVPWTLYQAYGDLSILEENYDMMAGWLSFVGQRAKKTRIHNQLNPYKKYLVDEGFHFGEWCEPDVDNMDTMKRTMMLGAPEVATAYYYRSASLMAEIASLLGKSHDADHYRIIAEGARNAYRFTCTKKGAISSTRQAEYVRPIAFGLLEDGEKATAAGQLARLVADNGYHLNTGFLSTPFLCRALSDNGHVNTAYRLLLQDTIPSWLYPVKKGATTIWECWDGIREDGTVNASLNHYSYGAISGWLFGDVCGIRLEYSGSAKPTLTFTPKVSPLLGHAEASWDSPVGLIKSSWRYEDTSVIFEFTVPSNMEALVSLPDENMHRLQAGEHSFRISAR